MLAERFGIKITYEVKRLQIWDGAGQILKKPEDARNLGFEQVKMGS